jgi:hypothetical protein
MMAYATILITMDIVLMPRYMNDITWLFTNTIRAAAKAAPGITAIAK